ncbi:crossover junction endodeoxyribonuclease RuvC [Microaerobacter geothermalis]|uniref:crossover junction endodeoxyribonuclease RuvC n=1 Tax=Microaerobacter geothermalis TaxID=674972 RepID=UPI001F438D19|nr:crossover junction endodeoxyribonuclease RuvC [Microaerobacter geothermalis]MCF6092745.1 crossover junction endodeoxyribonuclease RuvC [Microaerobacter geothermalis]
MRILGIDPGVAIVGFGIVEKKGSQLKPVQYGSIQTASDLHMAARLKQIYGATLELIEEYQPACLAIEKLFFNRNVTTAITVGQARGVLLLAAEQKRLSISEYTPLQVKMSVVGYGQAEKRQIQEMVRVLLKLKEIPKPDDVADALAIAITHAHSSTLEKYIYGDTSL